MIKITDGELLDMLPSSMKNDTHMICISYALKVVLGSLLEYRLGAMTQNYIEYAPEEILDIMAVELRVLYYRDDLDVEKKRALVKNALAWHAKAGTPAAVDELIEVMFGSGYVVEWFDFDEEGEPGTFDIVSTGDVSVEAIENMNAIINRVKNARSHLRDVLFGRSAEMEECAGMNGTSYPWVTVANNLTSSAAAGQASYVLAAAVSKPYINVE